MQVLLEKDEQLRALNFAQILSMYRYAEAMYMNCNGLGVDALLLDFFQKNDVWESWFRLHYKDVNIDRMQHELRKEAIPRDSLDVYILFRVYITTLYYDRQWRLINPIVFLYMDVSYDDHTNVILYSYTDGSETRIAAQDIKANMLHLYNMYQQYPHIDNLTEIITTIHGNTL